MTDPDRYEPEPLQPRREDRRRSWIVWAAALALLMALAAAYLARQRPPGGAPGTTAPPEVERPAPETSAAPVAEAPAVPLPPLDTSDAFVRERAAALAAAPEVQSWLGNDHLLRRAAAVVAAVAEGRSPREPLSVLAPAGSFQVLTRDGRLYIDPAAYARYDRIAAVVTAIDPHAAAALLRLVEPLLAQAHGEIARPGETLDPALARATDRLVSTPISAPAEEIEVVPGDGVGYQFADPALEALSPAEKHLLRMGPENARRIQDWLRALRSELGLAR